ncbi:hypothetical protein AMS68_007681 [Peltaster fructicola]|uniref:Uncharacterized protein n=1 Tax=Peltaster fructicola TaxID=286661 RepID=A0A6H0Y571_9PEZI|nr:hypothetical protein AMS68_007681 [Peltaster fructicola]
MPTSSTSSTTAVGSPTQDDSSIGSYTLMSYAQACETLHQENKRYQELNPAMNTSLRGDEQDYRNAAAQVLAELNDGSYVNDCSCGYSSSLFAALDEMVEELVESSHWIKRVDVHGVVLYIHSASERQTTVVEYLNSRGVAHFQAYFDRFLHDRASAIKRARVVMRELPPAWRRERA